MHRHWLPKGGDLVADIRQALALEPGAPQLRALRTLGNQNHDFAGITRLGRTIEKVIASLEGPVPDGFQPVRLALLSTSTTSHLAPALRAAGLGRNLAINLYEPAFGQVFQEIARSDSQLHAFAPTTILFANDPYSLFGTDAGPVDDPKKAAADVANAIALLREQWQRARGAFDAHIIQQLPFNPFERLLGENEPRLPGAPASLIASFQQQVRLAAAEDGVDLIDLPHWTQRHGLAAWHSPALWHRSKQEIHPAITPLFGDIVARVIAARLGRSAKCLVLDLDNTLWGGVIGDDGLEGIAIGQGSAAGEGHLSLQRYAKLLARRGIILAVCSKNDHAVALTPFENHPDMLLRADDFSSFVANWADKATNLRHIADELNIGLDALVFVDDNPFERELVRRDLPQVHVPELSDEPAEFAQAIADSGWFESASLTGEDLAKTEQYRSNRQRQSLLAEETDLDSYLAALDMQLDPGAFTAAELPRIVQLINKTNQFNLRTQRYLEPAVARLIDDPAAITRRFRLSDRFGDNGLIAVVIGLLDDARETLTIDTWLMSCRVLGRRVEHATLNVLVEAANQAGASRIVGEYIPSERNGMVKQLYADLGFSLIGESGGTSRWSLDLADYNPLETNIGLKRD
jgi:FkbH-like protein